MEESDPLARALSRQVQTNKELADQKQADLEYSRGQAIELTKSFRRFLAAMKASGNPGLKRPPNGLFSSPSWEEWVWPDGTVSNFGPKRRKSIDAYTLELLTTPDREGTRPGSGGWTQHVNAKVKYVNDRLVRIMIANGVGLS